MDFDLITAINLLLCLLVVAAGYLAYRKDKGAAWLYLALAFSLFALSHLVTLAGAATALYDPMVFIRALGYLLVIFGIYKGTAKVVVTGAAPAEKPQRKRK